MGAEDGSAEEQPSRTTQNQAYRCTHIQPPTIGGFFCDLFKITTGAFCPSSPC
jgi:hypothetical protein